MRIKTDGAHEYRLDLLRRVIQRTSEGTKSGAFDFATAFTLQMLDALEEASQAPPPISASARPPTPKLAHPLERSMDSTKEDCLLPPRKELNSLVSNTPGRATSLVQQD